MGEPGPGCVGDGRAELPGGSVPTVLWPAIEAEDRPDGFAVLAGDVAG